jgi:hypothetical protein
MSAFVVYLIGLGSTVYIFRKQNRSLLYSRFTLAALFVVITLFSFSSARMETQLQLVDASYYASNAPIGEAKGIFPGRVVWVWNPGVTNANMSNTLSDYWALDKNCNQSLVDSMLCSGIRRIGGKSDVKEAWEEIFKYFNHTHGKGYTGYSPGEKFAIKINTTNSCCITKDPGRIDASPQMVLGILRQLIDIVGVAQDDIWIGDNYRKFRDEYYDKCYAEYPGVHYIDNGESQGQEQTVPSAEQVLVFSDLQETSSLPQHYLDAAYLINMACLKTHNEGGITLCAKNHQGSILHEGDSPSGQSAMYMHYSLPANNQGLKQYRHLVDYMGHKDMGGKTLINIIDGLWAGRSWEGFLEKWQIAPFSNDYPSSVFLSQDPVAIESVGFDFLLAEYANKPTDQKYPYISGVGDYLLQAASKDNWPSGISYDPEGDGIPIGSLGTYEHWNNASDKQYSRNLGTGNGIELKKYTALAVDNYSSENTWGLSAREAVSYCSIYPNPFKNNIKIGIPSGYEMIMKVYDLQGKLVFSRSVSGPFTWNATGNEGATLQQGTYILKLSDKGTGEVMRTEKIIHY